MKSLFIFGKFNKFCLLLFCLIGYLPNVQAEGSKDFREYPGHRLFFNAEQRQQLKVFAAEGEILNLGTSHLGISGGFMTVYRPDGTLHGIINGSDGLGIINNDIEELAGPTGGGTINGAGYIPATVVVGTGQTGVWTVKFEYTGYTQDAFVNILNSAAWSRTADQPPGQRVVLAWDITVSQSDAANMGGTMLEGRVYSNEYISIQNGNDVNTSPTFYVLTKDGYQYQIDFKDTDPWGFPLFSNSVGLVNPTASSCYLSAEQSNFNRSDDPNSWTVGNKYLFDPQSADFDGLINNKIFFNQPDPNLPTQATVTDLNNLNTHTTWLYKEVEPFNPQFDDVVFQGIVPNGGTCDAATTTEVGVGGAISFNINTNGTAKVSLDLNSNGIFTDSIDRVFYDRVEVGQNTVNWDGKDGKGHFIGAALNFRINYKLEVRGGEIHIMMLDVENNPGGVVFTRLNGSESPSKTYYYDHSAIGGSVSGNGTSGNARATVEPYTYDNLFGNNRMLDYWSYVEFTSSENGGFSINIIGDCNQAIIDYDLDLIPDFADLDDDNDGIADFSEYCNPEGDFVCLPGGLDPSADQDNDNIPNYLDSSDPAINNNCVDANADGQCDQVSAVYDSDGDGVPDHLDLDSDNDGITDLVEAGHQQPDEDGNGIIDGDNSFFGQNGLFNAIASDPDAFSAFETYGRIDTDRDGVPDHDDLDADNDGINDVVEANFVTSDSNGDGRIDDGNGNPPVVSITGLAPIIDPAITTIAIPLPLDTDADGIPDWHDLDSDNDGINDVAESVKTDGDNDGIIGMGIPIVDANGKAISDISGAILVTTSQPTNTDGTTAADFRDLDADDDGINDVDEADQPDNDGDGRIGMGNPVVNLKGQIIQDAAGISLSPISNPEDTDTDQKPDFQDVDRDGDGISDAYECPGGWPCVNTDEDLLPDVDDLDSDDDKLLDKEECPGGAPCADSNTNNVANFLEYDCNVRNTPSPNMPIGGGQFCEGVAIQLNASGDTAFTEMLNYIWTGPNDFEYFGKNPANATFPVNLTDTRPEASGTYELVLETVRGCQSEPLKVVLDLMDKPVAPSLTVNEAQLCVGESLQLEVNTYSGDMVSYVWYKQTDGNPLIIDTTNIATLLVAETEIENAGIYTAIVNVNGCTSSISNAELVEVKTPIESPVATSSATIINPSCEGETVALTVPFREGAIYEWAGPNNYTSDQSNPTLPNATSLNNGNYNAMVTFDGCSVRTNTVTVMVYDRPITPILKMEDVKQCEGESATLTIIEPLSYPSNNTLQFEWFAIGNTSPVAISKIPTFDLENLTEAENGDYYVEVSLLGCKSLASNVQAIEVQPSLNVSASSSAALDNPACEGDMVRLTGSLFSNATYEWYGPNGLITDQPSTSLVNATSAVDGEYIFVVTVDNCPSSSKPVQVKVNPKPVQPVIALDNAEPCTGENVALSITNAGTIAPESMVKVDWYNTNSNQIIATTDNLNWNLENLNNIDDGEYYGILNIDGCSSDQSNTQQIITQPGLTEVKIISNAEANVSPVCEGAQVNLAIPFEDGVTYQWFGPNGQINNTNNSLIIENSPSETSGEYYVIREKAGCTRKSESINIQVSPMPATPILSTVDGPQCKGGEISLNISNPQQMPSSSEVIYNWYHVQANELVGTSTQPIFTLTNLSESKSGTYYVILSVAGCNTAPSNVASVVVQSPTTNLVATASAGVDSPVCEGENVYFNVPFIIDATYEWYGPNGFVSNFPNPNIPTISLADAGTYYAVVTSSICPVLTNEIHLMVNEKPELPNLTIDATQKCEGETTTLSLTKPSVFPENAMVEYDWFTTDSDVPIASTDLPTLTQTDLTLDENDAFYAVVRQDGCASEISNTVSLEVNAIPNEVAFIMESSKNACNQREIQIDAIQPNIGSGQWTSNANLSIVDPLNPSTLLLDVRDGVNKVYWSLSYKGCLNYSIDSLIIIQTATLVEAQDDEFTIDLNGELVQANVIANDLTEEVVALSVQLMTQPSNGQLIFENGMAQYQPNTNFFGTDMFEYEICATNCPDQCDVAMVRVNVVDNVIGKDCFAPNVITPNDDGMNDCLKIPCVASHPQSKLKVFNRWGDLVHASDNYDNTWAGTFNGSPLPNGTYFYLLQMGTKEESMQGYFTIVR